MTTKTITTEVQQYPFTLARRAQGFGSSAHLAAAARLCTHTQGCIDCGEGRSVLLDDGWQPTFQYCPAAKDLDRAALEISRSDQARAKERATGRAPLNAGDRAILAREVVDSARQDPTVVASGVPALVLTLARWTELDIARAAAVGVSSTRAAADLLDLNPEQTRTLAGAPAPALNLLGAMLQVPPN